MKRAFLIISLLVIALAQLAAAQEDIVMKAMRDELSRSMSQMRLEKLEKPYFIAYRVDLILWRRLIGTVTDGWYLKPTFRWEALEGLNVSAQVVYSQAIYAQSTPSGTNRPLGIELDLGIKYQSDDGFIFFIDYGLLRLLSGFDMSSTSNSVTTTVGPSGVAQNLHLGLGIVF